MPFPPSNAPSNNTVTVTGAATNPIAVSVYGGYDATGAVTGNTVIIDSSAANTTVGKDVYGGYSGSDAVSKTTVTVKSSDLTNTTTVTGNVVGGKSATGTVRDGVAEVSGAGVTVGGDVVGAWIDNALATGDITGTNTATLSNGLVGGSVIGARNSGTGKVTGAQATLGGGKVTGKVAGGVSLGAGAVTGSQVTVTGGEVFKTPIDLNNTTGHVIGGHAIGGGDVTSNTVTMTGGTVLGDLRGGESGVNGSVTPTGNAANNAVIMSGGKVALDLVGGVTRNTTGNATNNTVLLTGGEVTRDILGGYAANGDVTGNSITISGGTVGGQVLGGNSLGGVATHNSVTISGGEVRGSVTGGLSSGAAVTHNSITIFQGATFSSTTSLYGGFSQDIMADVFTGNSLTVYGLLNGGETVGSVQNFQSYSFLKMPAAPTGQALLTAGSVNLAGPDGVTNAKVDKLGILGGGPRLAVGTEYTLVTATGSAITINGAAYDATSLTARKGIGADYAMTVGLNTAGDSLVATVASAPTGTEEGKALMEGRAGTLGFVNQGADLVANQGIGSALAATSGAPGVAGFGALGGGSSRYDSGSHVDVDGLSLMAGVGWRSPVNQNALLLGTFFEAGWGSYDTYNAFNIRGSGDTSYYGGGVLARYDLTEGAAAGLYTEASVRAGRVSTDFSSTDLLPGDHTSYDSAATYVGAHAGLGYIWRLSDQASLDLSTKYLWTHQGSDSVTVAGEDVRFDGSDSHRWRNGARFSYAVTTETGGQFTPYIGGAYDHEFDGKAKGSVGGVDQNAPSLAGGTGIGELGVTFKPVSTSGLSADLGVQGYVGMREGVTGSLQVKYTF